MSLLDPYTGKGSNQNFGGSIERWEELEVRPGVRKNIGVSNVRFGKLMDDQNIHRLIS